MFYYDWKNSNFLTMTDRDWFKILLKYEEIGSTNSTWLQTETKQVRRKEDGYFWTISIVQRLRLRQFPGASRCEFDPRVHSCHRLRSTPWLVPFFIFLISSLFFLLRPCGDWSDPISCFFAVIFTDSKDVCILVLLHLSLD